MLISAGLAWAAALTTAFFIAPGLAPARAEEEPVK